jgi:hypothetical protein
MSEIQDKIENWFVYHPPNEVQLVQYAALREAGKALATFVANLCPPGDDRDAAILRIREAVMLANSSIACGGK